MLLARSEIYKTPRPHEEELCRPGDLAEIRRSHCTQESGLIVEVMGEPHFCFCMCAECGQDVTEYFVEVWAVDAAWWFKTPGPWFMPIKWLKRIDPRDRLKHARVKNYAPLEPTDEQIIAANR